MTWTSEELAASTCHGSLTLGGVSMNNKAWASLNNFVLWGPADRRSSNLMIPGRPGSISMLRRKADSSRTLECLVIGDCNQVGTPHASRESGLATNFMTLRSSVFGWTGTSVTASLSLPNGSTISGAAQIIQVELGSTNISGALTFTIDLDLPDGELT